MPDWNLVTRQHVLAAIAECDQLGSREFLARYHFGRAPAYTLWHGGQEYDSKAILGVAYLHATGRAATSDEFSGGKDGAAMVLAERGFDIVVDEELAAQVASLGARAAGEDLPALLHGPARHRRLRQLRLTDAGCRGGYRASQAMRSPSRSLFLFAE